jgi:hypothetical protein
VDIQHGGGVSDENEGLPLWDALRAYGDPELWAAYEGARAKLRSISARPRWSDTSRREREAWLDRYEAAKRAARNADRAWQVLGLDFKRRLQRGELVATGLKRPISEQSERVVIPAHLWSVLLLNFKRSRVTADDIEFVDVRVRQAAAAQREAHECYPPASRMENAPAVHLEPGQGRPSIKHILGAEMRRRAEGGELRDKITPECRALRAWAECHVKDKHVPEVDSIRKALSELYYSLKEEINKEK